MQRIKVEEKSAKVNSLPLVSECGSAYRCQKTSSFWYIMHGLHLNEICVMYLVWMWLALIHWLLKAKFGAQKRTSCRLLASKTRLRLIGLSASPSLNIPFILENVKDAPNLFAAPKQKNVWALFTKHTTELSLKKSIYFGFAAIRLPK